MWWAAWVGSKSLISRSLQAEPVGSLVGRLYKDLCSGNAAPSFLPLSTHMGIMHLYVGALPRAKWTSWNRALEKTDFVKVN